MNVKDILFRLLGLELLINKIEECSVLIFHKVKKVIVKELWKYVTKSFLFYLVIKLLGFALLFFLIALALYLDEIFCSTYMGFLIVGGGSACVGGIVLLLIYCFFSTRKKI